MWPKLLYLELSAIDRAARRAEEPGRRGGGWMDMSSAMRTGLPRPGSKVQLLLRAQDGTCWGLTLSCGMERFIGHYPRVAGLGSGGPLLRYRRHEAARGRS